MATRSIVPRANNEGGLGSASKMWASLYSVLATITTATITTLTATTSTLTSAAITNITALVSAVMTNSLWTAISTPASGKTTLFVDDKKRLKIKDDAGFVSGGIVNFSTSAQAPAAATRTYLAGSNVDIVAGQLQVGTIIRWTMSVTKTAAGTAASTYDICFGTAGTTADTARLSFTKPAGTAAADEGTIIIDMIVRGPIGASNVMVGQFTMVHNLASTGHATIPCVCVNTVSAAFDATTATDIGVCVTSGASDALTFQMVKTEVLNA